MDAKKIMNLKKKMFSQIHPIMVMKKNEKKHVLFFQKHHTMMVKKLYIYFF